VVRALKSAGTSVEVISIAGMILIFVLCYELITMIIKKNNMHADVLFSVLDTALLFCL